MNKPRECTITHTHGDAVVERSHDVTLRVNNLKANDAGRISLNVPIENHEIEKKRLQSHGLAVDENHEGLGKRALCFCDPEGNEVKLVC